VEDQSRTIGGGRGEKKRSRTATPGAGKRRKGTTRGKGGNRARRRNPPQSVCSGNEHGQSSAGPGQRGSTNLRCCFKMGAWSTGPARLGVVLSQRALPPRNGKPARSYCEGKYSGRKSGQPLSCVGIR